MKRVAWPALTMVAAVFLSAGGSHARAEIREESWEFEVLLGYYSPGPDFLDSDTTFGFRLTLKAFLLLEENDKALVLHWAGPLDILSEPIGPTGVGPHDSV